MRSQDTNAQKYQAYIHPRRFLRHKISTLENIIEFGWDCLIILDTCRPDGLETVSAEYDFINNISTHWSVGGDSWEWMANTFVSDYIEKLKIPDIILQTLTRLQS